MQVCKYASMQVCMYASMQVCKYASMQVCKYAGMYFSAGVEKVAKRRVKCVQTREGGPAEIKFVNKE